MKSNNKHYEDNIIDYDALNLLPSGGSIFNDSRTYDIDDDFHEEEGSLEDGPAQSNASRPYSNKENDYVTNNYASLNPLIENETNDASAQNISNKAMGTANNSEPFQS